MNFEDLLGFSNRSISLVPVNVGDISNSAIDGEHPMVMRKRHNYDGGVGMYQYMVGVAWMFMGTIMLEGVVTSLMAKSACGKVRMLLIPGDAAFLSRR